MAKSENKPGIINCHTHIITANHLPGQLFLFPLPLVSLLKNNFFRTLLVGILYIIAWPLAVLRLDKWWNLLIEKRKRLLSVANIAEHKKQKDILKILVNSYPQDGTRFVVMALDTWQMGKGTWGLEPYDQQLRELKNLSRSPEYRGKIFPFVHADPRRLGFEKLVIDCLEDGFYGIKIYPPFGVLPYDKQMDGIYQYAVDHNVPVIGHCTEDGMKGKKYKDGDNIFASPDNYKKLLNKYPTLKLCLAHFGGNQQWDNYLTKPWEKGEPESWVSKIINMINEDDENGNPKYPNLYTDIAYAAYSPASRAYLKVMLGASRNKRLRERILFGTDFYVLNVDIAEREFSIGLRGDIGEEMFDQIARINPRRFLNLAD